MSISRKQFADVVVTRTLATLGLPYMFEARALLMAIAAYESSGGRFLVQVRGPALGPWQMEPGTFDLLRRRCREWGHGSLEGRSAIEMATDLALACRAARLLLWFEPTKLPKVSDPTGQYETYLRVWRPGRKPSFAKFRDAVTAWT
jgi:hypothetical protein